MNEYATRQQRFEIRFFLLLVDEPYLPEASGFEVFQPILSISLAYIRETNA